MKLTDFQAFAYAPASGRTNQDLPAPAADRIIVNRLLGEDAVAGCFFSGIYQGRLRVHIVLEEDTAAYHPVIAALLAETRAVSGGLPGTIWVGNHNRRVMDFLVGQYGAVADPEVFHYDSVEYRMPRDGFARPAPHALLAGRPFERRHLDAYLRLLTDSMRFKIPPHDYRARRAHYLAEFERLDGARAFEAFWLGETLIGLYWLEGIEIDHLAVSTAHQRQGFGRAILYSAIARVFDTCDTDHALLYAVGWNSQAQAFYLGCGMQAHARYRVRYAPPAEA